MNNNFELLRSTRKIVSHYLDKYTVEELNKIPSGFKNNIIWNAAHIVSIQEILTYKLCGLDVISPKNVVYGYKNGTAPESDVTEDFVSEVNGLLVSSMDALEQNYIDGKFTNFKPYKTLTGVTLTSIEDAIGFNVFHEGLHTGYIMSIRKYVR